MTKVRKPFAANDKPFTPCEPPPDVVEEVKTVTTTTTRVVTTFEGDPEPKLGENEEIIKVEKRKKVYTKRSEEGLCDYNFCRCKTFMRCDYDLNDIIDTKSKWPQLVLCCRWRGIRGCGREFCHWHAGEIRYWPTSFTPGGNSIAVLPCDDCQYWIDYVKLKTCGFVLAILLWFILAILLIYYSTQGVQGSFEYEYARYEGK